MKEHPDSKINILFSLKKNEQYQSEGWEDVMDQEGKQRQRKVGKTSFVYQYRNLIGGKESEHLSSNN